MIVYHVISRYVRLQSATVTTGSNDSTNNPLTLRVPACRFENLGTRSIGLTAERLRTLSEHSLHPATDVVRRALEILVVSLAVPLGPERLVPGLDDIVRLGANAIPQVGIGAVQRVTATLRLELGETLEEGRGGFFRRLLL